MKRSEHGDPQFTVLVVEDNAAHLKVLTDILTVQHLKPIGCLTARDALYACREHDVYVAVIDLRLPDMNGLELLRQLKQQTPNIKAIIHTGYATLESAMEALNHEAFAYVRKVGDAEELLVHIHRAFHAYLAGYSEELEREVDKGAAELSAANDALRQEIAVREKAEREITRQSRNLQQLSTQLMNAQEAERKRISRELHDGMGQALTAMSLNLAAIEKEALSGIYSGVSERVAETRALIDQMLDQARELSRNLRPGMLDDLGLLPALRWYLKRYAARVDAEVTFRTVHLDERVPPDVETAVYRIVQEALTNVAKHAEATCVDVSLERRDMQLLVSIRDNGRGFKSPQTDRFDAEDGIGILGMQERAVLLHGKLQLQSSPGNGTTVLVHIPLQKEDEVNPIFSPDSF